MATIWGLTLVNLALLVGVLMNRIKADFGLFGYMSGFIVAMYFFREMFPDVPRCSPVPVRIIRLYVCFLGNPGGGRDREYRSDQVADCGIQR